MHLNQGFRGQTVYIHLSARNLKNLNTLYVSDTKCRVYQNNQLIGETEISKHNLNPDWRQPIPITYHFNIKQKLKFEIVDANQDIVGQLTQLALNGDKKQSFIGSTKEKLGKLMGAPNSLTKVEIENDEGQKTGSLIIYINRSPPPQQQQQQQQIQQQDIAQQLVQQIPQDTQIRWKWGGLKLLDLDFFSKSDPFAKFYKFTEGDKILLHETEFIKNDLNPKWKEWSTTERHLIEHQPRFYVEVWDYDKLGGHDFIGDVTIDYFQIKSQHITEFQLSTKKGKKAGSLKILDLSIIAPPPPKPLPPPPPTPIEPIPEPPKEITFLDYLMGSWQLSMILGIDFTFSNQPITKIDSLHKIEPNKLNYYQKAIKEIGGGIIAFDHDKSVPVFGFGGTPKLPNYTRNTMDDCFPLNGNAANPECQDIQGILQAYIDAVPNIVFSGPTFVTKILQGAYDLAKKNAANDIYTVSILMTDGQIEDMDDAIKVIAQCCELPISIIIIGVGDENFKYMKQLDDINYIKKQSKSEKDLRDILQFVSYQDFKNDIDQMSAAVLDQLPKQFMGYMNLHNIQPKAMNSVHLSQAFKA